MNKTIIVIGGIGLLILVVTLLNLNKTEEKVTPVENKVEEKAKVEPVVKIDHHLHHADIEKNGNLLSADLTSIGLMPLNGESGAVGYGLITDKGTDAVVVSTTHGGVLDSEKQKDASDAVWHNHMVKLGKVELCGENPGVIDITFESPGNVDMKKQGLVMADVPASFSGKHSLTNAKIAFDPGVNIQKVVQFSLEPKFSATNELQAVCVTNIEEVTFKAI